MTPIRLLIVDDHQIIREGLRFLCAREPDLAMAGEAADGSEALTEYERLLPEVVIMDIGMPVMDGVKATAELLARYPKALVVALSMHADPYYIDLMKRAGAVGYVLKDEASAALAAAVRKVMGGETAFSS